MSFTTRPEHKTLSLSPSSVSGKPKSDQNGSPTKIVRSRPLLHLLLIWVDARPTDTFDILLTRDLSRAHIVDFNPYAPRTDPLLFTYEDLYTILLSESPDQEPEFRVIDSRTHPAALSNAPAHQHNMIPYEALSLSSGRDIEEFADLWKEEIKHSMGDGVT